MLENDEMVASQNDSNFASWLALAGVALLYLVVYRGLRYPLMTVATLLVGTVWALGWLTLTVGHLNILSSAFAVMLIGMGDYGVLWVTRFGQERQAGADVAPGACARTALSVGPSILTAAVTTALAFFAAMLADLKAVAELGWIAGSGVLLCALSCFIVMPALLALFDFRSSRKRRATRRSCRSQEHQAEHAAMAARPDAAAALGHRRAAWSSTLVLGYFALQDSLRSQPAQPAGPEPRFGAVGANADRAHDRRELARPQLHDDAGGSPGPQGTLRAAARGEPGRRGRVAGAARPGPQARACCATSSSGCASCPSAATTDPARRCPSRRRACDATRCSNLLPIGRWQRAWPGCTKLRGTARSSRSTWRTQPDSRRRAGRALQRVRATLTRDLAEDLHRLRDVSTPDADHVADLPACLRERYIGKNGKWLLRIFAKDCLWDFEPLEHSSPQVRTVDPEATGKPFTTLEGCRR